MINFRISQIRSAVTVAAFVLTTLHASAQGGGAARPRASMDYRVAVDVPAETFVVRAEIKGVVADTMTFFFPIWGPGAYDIVNFGGYVSDFTAVNSAGKALRVIRSDTNTFRIVAPDRAVRISYRVHDIERNDNSLWFGLSDIEKNYAFANTPAIFGYAAGYKDIPYTVTYALPKGWDIAVGLDPLPGKASGAERAYLASDYDDLVDAPVTMGTFQRMEFAVKGVPHLIAVFSARKLSASETADLTAATKRIVEIVSGFFGDMPYKRYVFQHFLVNYGSGDAAFGALEHRNSSTYRMPYNGEGGVELLKSVIAHEYWHAWSPKRIHVAELGPFDHQRAPHTSSLWFAEGLTEYYAKVLLMRNNMADRDEILDLLGSAVSSIAGKPQRMSIADLSLKVAELPLNEVVALYSKGPVIGLLLDAAIRTQTGNRKGLDDAMKYFNEQYGRTGKTFSDDDIIPGIERATGAKLADFYGRYIAGRDSLPLLQYLPQIGLAISTTYEEKPTLGAEVEQTEGGWKITEIEPGGSAEAMGLRVGDTMKEIKFGGSEMKLQRIPPSVSGTLMAIPQLQGFTVLRSAETLTVAAKVLKSKVAVRTVAVDDHATAEARAIRKSMFGF